MRVVEHERQRRRYWWHWLSRFLAQNPASLRSSRGISLEIWQPRRWSQQSYKGRSFLLQNAGLCFSVRILKHYHIFLIEVQFSRAPRDEHPACLHNHQDNVIGDSIVGIQVHTQRCDRRSSTLLSFTFTGPLGRIHGSCHFCTKHEEIRTIRVSFPLNDAFPLGTELIKEV